MRGPKPKGEGPHNQTIDNRIDELKNQGMTHENGGSKTEETVSTDGGVKSSRRPDITMREGDGTLYRENVGRTYANGDPIKRGEYLRGDCKLDCVKGSNATKPISE